MTLLKSLAALALGACAAVALAAGDPPGVIGRLNYISGPVSFAPAQTPEDWAAATLNRPITTGDRLWTDSGGRAEMHAGSLAIRMDAQTSLDVLKLDDSGLQLRLAQGGANLRVRREGSDQPVEIATPGGAVVLTRPGSYRVNVDPGGSATSVAVRAGGQAQVFAPNGSFVVSDGQQATIGGSRQDLAAVPASDEFDRWAATRDQREDRVASTRYVPAEMTGYEDLDEHGTWRTVPQYGTVWQPKAVPTGWAPYRDGHWVWVAPWGWTWVDDAPWGFAPSHYGRWVWLGNYWAWAPGRMVARPVYAPAVVAFIGGSNFSVSVGVGSAPAVGWVPLGWREPYRPWYRASHAHVRNVNITHVTNVTNITNDVTNVRLANRNAPAAVTVVSRDNFVAARAVRPAAVRVPARAIAAAPVTSGSPVAVPERTSLAQARAGARPPAEVRTREAVAVSAPPEPARAVLRDRRDQEARTRLSADSERPRVRVVAQQERANPAQGEAQRATEQQSRADPQAKAVAAPERPVEKGTAPAPAQERRRAAAPSAEVNSRPTFDRSQQQVGRQAQEQRAREQQEQRQQQAQQQAQEQARQRGEQQAQQRAQEQAQRQRQAQQQAQERVRQRGEQQAQQRAQEQAQRQQQAQQQAQEQARQRAQQQGREQVRQQQMQQRAQQAQQQDQRQARQQRREQSQEKGGRERPRADKSEKG